jgi:hypothetical protein
VRQGSQGGLGRAGQAVRWRHLRGLRIDLGWVQGEAGDETEQREGATRHNGLQGR